MTKILMISLHYQVSVPIKVTLMTMDQLKDKSETMSYIIPPIGFSIAIGVLGFWGFGVY